MSDAEIDQHLSDAFNKFDESGDGQLGQWEFQQAWFYLGLKGTEDEIKDTFGEVDTNNSGLIDLKEFITAIKGERMLELSLTRVLNKMGVQYSDAQSEFESFKKTSDRRRLLKKTWEENLRNLSKELIAKLSTISSVEVPQKDPEKQKMYNTLRDTFDAFDKDGSAQLGYEEYRDAWKFLNRPGDESVIQNTFNSVDVDGSGLVEWTEFVFSLMGEEALEYGTLADMEVPM